MNRYLSTTKKLAFRGKTNKEVLDFLTENCMKEFKLYRLHCKIQGVWVIEPSMTYAEYGNARWMVLGRIELKLYNFFMGVTAIDDDYDENDHQIRAEKDRVYSNDEEFEDYVERIIKH